jgi:protein-S-isoprenylcysteine O-methyltransferase Ste14
MYFISFKYFYFIGLILGMMVKSPKYRQSSSIKPEKEQKSKLDRFLVFFQLFGMIIMPIFYLPLRIFDFADYHLPFWAGLSGVAVLAGSLLLIRRAQIDLGKNYSPKIRIKKDHTLITDGVYHYMRHPLYSAHWLMGIAQVLLLQNWIIGPANLITFLPFYLYRVPREEKMMLEQYGEKYRLYIKKTGRFSPFF